MSVTADWSLVDLGTDPCPGDVEGVRALAARLSCYADLAASNRDRLRAVAADVSGGPLHMRGDYAGAYVEQFAELPDELAKLEKAYRGCAAALGRFATRLDEAQGKARTALRAGSDAQDRFWWARRSADAALPAGTTLPWGSHGLSVPQADAATAGLDEATRSQVRAAVARAVSAKADQARAARLAREAAALRGDAERACVDEIDDALHDSGIANKSWWQKAWDKVSAPFRSWDDFVSLCEKVALVAGVVALFVSGPLGWAIMAASLAAGAVILADKLDKYAKGEASLLDVGLAVLGVIPFKPGALAEGARALVPALRAGGGKLLGEGAFGLRTAIPHGLEIAGGLRGAARDPALFARDVLCRAFKADPIDLATGEMFVDVVDLSLPVGPGAPPVAVRRIHQSSYQVGHRFGPAWNTTLDHRVEVDDTGVAYTGDDGLVLLFPPAPDGVAVECSHGPRLLLTRTAVPDPLAGVVETYSVHDPVSGLTEHFSAVGGVAGVTALPVVAVSDRAGRRTEYRYDADGWLTGIVAVDGSGRTAYRVRVETVDGRIAALVVEGRPAAGTGGPAEADVVVARYGYDTAGRLTHVFNSSGTAMRYAYDDLGRVVRWEDRNGTWYAYRYDEQGRCYAAEGTDGVLRARIGYDDSPAADGTTSARFTDSLGRTTVFTANAAHQLVRREDPLGGAWLQEWDDRNHLLAATDPLGRTTRYAYDDAGRATSVTLPDGAVTALDRDGTGLPTTATDPTGATWTSRYDEARGLLLEQTDPTGATTAFGWDDAGHLVAVTDPVGATTRVVCDPAGLPLEIVDPTGAATSVTRDALGRPVAVTDPAGATTRVMWTVEGHLRERVGPDGARWTWTYDAEGNLREATDPVGGTTRVVPTAWDQPAEVTTPDGATTRYTYDTERRLVAVTDPLGLTWRYAYDPRGDLVAETDFDGRTRSLTRDAAGQVVRRESAAGVAEYERDARGAVVAETAAAPSGVAVRTTFAYDAAGRLVRAANPDADLALARDAVGRVVTETTTDPLGVRTLASQHDPAGRRTGRTTPSGTVSGWAYDGAGRPLALTGGSDPLVRFGYDAAGRPTSRTLGPDPTGAVLDLAWNTSGLLAAQTLTSTAGDPVLRRTYGYADDGYLTRVEDLTGTTVLGLDPLRRITSAATGPGPAKEQYSYDPAGNITDAVWPGTDGTDGTDPDAAEGPRGTREHNGTRVVRAGRTTYVHDDAGRLVTRRTRLLSGGTRTHTYTWDAHDRLTTCTTPDGTVWRYTYDALGRRTGKHRLADDGTAVESVVFTWDATTLAEQTRTLPGADPVVTTWDHAPDGLTPLTQRTRTERDLPSHDRAPHEQAWYDERFHAIVTDLVGAPTDLVTPDGTVAWSRRTTIWGAPLDAAAADGTTVTCLLLFPGQYTDDETGLAYNYFRHYDPDTGRYASTDPLGLVGSPNPATYVGNPTAWTDPLGLTEYGAALNEVTHLIGKGDDPLVPELVRDIESLYPGHVRAQGIEIIGPAGSPLTDFDIVTRNAVVQVKSGTGKGALKQMLTTSALTDYPVIAYLPDARGSVITSLERAGLLVTRDKAVLLSILAP